MIDRFCRAIYFSVRGLQYQYRLQRAQADIPNEIESRGRLCEALPGDRCI
jgi:hypothetical protein